MICIFDVRRQKSLSTYISHHHLSTLLSSVHSDSDSSYASDDSLGSVGSGEVLADVRGKRQATKDPMLKRKDSKEREKGNGKKGKSKEKDVPINDELETFKKVESGDVTGLISAQEVQLHVYSFAVHVHILILHLNKHAHTRNNITHNYFFNSVISTFIGSCGTDRS